MDDTERAAQLGAMAQHAAIEAAAATTYGARAMILPAVLAFTVAATFTPLIRLALRRWNVLDVPNDRSSHRDPTPRGGGLGVAAAIVLAVVVARDLDGVMQAALVFAGVAFGSIGLLDDLVGVSPLKRLALLFAAAAASLIWLLRGLDGPVAWRVVFAVAVILGVVAYVNAFNFMDGINGLAVGQTVVAGAAWFVLGQARDLPWLAAIGVILVGGALGFAPHNANHRGCVFLGDIGSYFLGALLACVAVAALRAGLPPEAILAPLALYFADTGLTLVRRVARGDRWYEPHREHTYQRLTRYLGDSHSRVTLFAVVVMTGCAALGHLSLVGSVPLRVVGDAGIAVLLAAYVATPSLVANSRRRALDVVGG